jgi:hypothetical protein
MGNEFYTHLAPLALRTDNIASNDFLFAPFSYVDTNGRGSRLSVYTLKRSNRSRWRVTSLDIQYMLPPSITSS